MNNLKLKQQLVIRVSVLVTTAVILLSIMSFFSLSAAYNRVVSVLQEKLDIIIQSQVDCMIGVLQANYQRFQNGEITDEEARKNAADVVRSTKYNNGIGYFWADMADGTSAVHIKPEVEGTNRYDTQDEQGNYFVRDTIAAGDKEGGGFIDFYFTKPGESTAKQKRGYIKKFEPYGWYIGTGNYHEDMLPLIQSELDASNKTKTSAMLSLVVAGLTVLGLSILAMVSVADNITKPIKKVSERLELLSQGNIHNPVEIVHSKDEIGLLTSSLSKTVTFLSGYIENISYVLKKMDSYDMDVKIDLDYMGDFAPIKSSLLQTIDIFSNTISEMSIRSKEVSNGAEQVAGGAQCLSQSTTEQASAIQMLADSINEISKQIQINAGNTSQADNSSGIALETAQYGNTHMKNMVSAIEDISKASSEIGKIIKTIQNIAFQTDILALNAAVESARAGQSGKGFAVVADEVRNLAFKSAEAAKTSTELIESSAKAVQNGTQIAQETADFLEKIVTNVESTTSLLKEIAQASNQQASSITTLTVGINQITDAIQMNSANAEESAAASEELSGQANMLKDLVAKFNLGDNIAISVEESPRLMYNAEHGI